MLIFDAPWKKTERYGDSVKHEISRFYQKYKKKG